MNICGQCGGAVMVPWLSYGYAGKVCMCSRRAPVTPMPQAQIDEALVLAMDADKREIERLRAELAASQAREKALREKIVLAQIGSCSCGAKTPDTRYHSAFCVYSQLAGILALPADDTALREMLARAQEEMRERCIEEVRGVGGIDAIEVERLIRALEVKP